MNLVIDQGNTKAKLALFAGGHIASATEVTELTVEAIERFIGTASVEACILSSVTQIPLETGEFLATSFKRFINLDVNTILPIQIGYRTPQTLGADRIAAVVGASLAAQGHGAVVVDAGTAITFDCLTPEGVFMGGNIAPGISMRLRALHEFTGRLPLVAKEGDTPLAGYSTETAIRAGVVGGVCAEIEGFVAAIRATHPALLAFLTGGDTEFLADKLKCSIFADKNLVLKGLNRILNYNVEQ